MIKILTGWSNPGGSTKAHISLCNLFNKNNIECILLGPHNYHLDKCNAGILTNEITLNKNDIAIIHFLQLNKKLPCKRKIYSCHEKNILPLSRLNLSIYDAIHFVSQGQYEWHNINNINYEIIPPLITKINWKNPNNNIAGVIGSIDQNKQTHVSIERAINQGYEKVYLFGKITDEPFYNQYVKPFIDCGKAVYKGHTDNKEEMYNSISKIFHFPLSECFSLVHAECKVSQIKYEGSKATQLTSDILTEEEILLKWKKILNL